MKLRLVIFVFCLFGCVAAQAQNNDTTKIEKQESKPIDGVSSTVYSEQIPAFSYHGKGFSEFIVEKLVYPKSMIDAGVEAKVLVDFVVDTLGRVSNVASNDEGKERIKLLVEEAIRVVKLSSGYWTSGMIKGKKVKMKMRIPISFTLE